MDLLLMEHHPVLLTRGWTGGTGESLLSRQLLPLGEGQEASPASPPDSHFSKPPFLPVKVIFLSNIIYGWKTICSRRALATHIQTFPSRSNL